MRRVAILVIMAVLSSLAVAVQPASADVPHTYYSCFETDSGNVFPVHKLSQCLYGRITIYSTYDTKVHGHIYVEDGRAVKNLTWGQFCKVVVHLSEAAASKVFWKKVWTLAKKFYKNSKADDPDLPIEPVP